MLPDFLVFRSPPVVESRGFFELCAHEFMDVFLDQVAANLDDVSWHQFSLQHRSYVWLITAAGHQNSRPSFVLTGTHLNDPPQQRVHFGEFCLIKSIEDYWYGGVRYTHHGVKSLFKIISGRHLVEEMGIERP